MVLTEKLKKKLLKHYLEKPWFAKKLFVTLFLSFKHRNSHIKTFFAMPKLAKTDCSSLIKMSFLIRVSLILIILSLVDDLRKSKLRRLWVVKIGTNIIVKKARCQFSAHLCFLFQYLDEAQDKFKTKFFKKRLKEGNIKSKMASGDHFFFF
jgi:hypothetical protein